MGEMWQIKPRSYGNGKVQVLDGNCYIGIQTSCGILTAVFTLECLSSFDQRRKGRVNSICRGKFLFRSDQK